MARLAGFDFVMELAPAALAELLWSNLSLGGESYSPPFERTQTVPDSQGGGTLHLIVDALTVTVNSASPDLTIVFQLSHSSLLGHRSRDFFGLSGTITVSTRVTLEPSGTDGTGRRLVVNLSTSSLRAHITGGSASEVENLIAAGIGLAFASLPANPGMDLPLTVANVGNGSLAPLVVRELVVCGTSEAAARSLAICGTLLDRNVGAGDSATLLSSIPPGRNMCILVAPGVFHTLVFVPQVMAQLHATDPALLPPTCGSGTGVVFPDVPGFQITRAADTFQNGSIGVEIRADEITDGAALDSAHSVEVFGILTVELVGSSLVPRWMTQRVLGGNTFGPGWWALGFFLSPLFLEYMRISALATYFAAAGSADALSFAPAPVGLPRVLPMTIEDVEISAEGMAISGTAMRAVRGFNRPSLRLAGMLTTITRETVDAGTFVSTGFPEGEYRWTRVDQTQQFLCTPSVRMASHPVRFEWFIEVPGGGPRVRLDSSSGELVFSAQTFVPSTIPGAHETRTIAITFSVDANSMVTLNNRNEDGEFHVSLTCEATDQADRMMTEYIHVDLRGSHIEMGSRTDGNGTWAGDLQASINYISQRVQQLERETRVFPNGPVGGQDPFQFLGRGPIPEEMGPFLVNAARFKDAAIRKQILTNVQATFGATALLWTDAPLALLRTASLKHAPIEMPTKGLGK